MPLLCTLLRLNWARENMSRTGLYDCHILKIFIDNFMRISNFGMGILHVKVKY